MIICNNGISKENNDLLNNTQNEAFNLELEVGLK